MFSFHFFLSLEEALSVRDIKSFSSSLETFLLNSNMYGSFAEETLGRMAMRRRIPKSNIVNLSMFINFGKKA